jgi:hypothetical protein
MRFGKESGSLALGLTSPKMISAIPFPVSFPPYQECTCVVANEDHWDILIGVPDCVTIMVSGLALRTAVISLVSSPGRSMFGRSKPSLSQSFCVQVSIDYSKERLESEKMEKINEPKDLHTKWCTYSLSPT